MPRSFKKYLIISSNWGFSISSGWDGWDGGWDENIKKVL